MANEKIIDTAVGATDGQTKCPKCGATDISTNTTTGTLRCNFCRFEFKAEVLEDMKEGVDENLSGVQVGSGAADIDANAETMITLKCTSCGAEVVINLNESSQARCHWCRNMLSVNNKVPNGMVPDTILPFKMKKDEARSRIEQFVGDRKFFANKKFASEFTTENIMGVYFPYMLVDMKGHASFAGEGEIERGSYQRKTGEDSTETVYKVERFSVARECDVEVDDLPIESSSRRASGNNGETNNIINAILPFDTENCVKYDSNYLKGFTSEKRDVNKGDLQAIADSQEKEAVKFALNKSVSQYGRGVRWDKQEVTKQGEKWMAAYLPVWLYSYVENPGSSNQLTHYVAVNARTSETIGSVPINKGRISSVSALVGLIALIVSLLFIFLFMSEPGAGHFFGAIVVAIAAGGIFFSSKYNKYRNVSARHHFETETKIKVSNIKQNDASVKKFETTNSTMQNANNTTVNVQKLNTKKKETK